MGSVQGWYECPKCKTANVYNVDYYYNTEEEYGFCTHCGYSHRHTIKRDENKKPVFKLFKKYDLKAGNVIYGKKDKNLVLVKELPVLPTDTKEDVNTFMNIRSYLEGKDGRILPEKFELFAEEDYDSLKEYDYYAIYHKEDGEVKPVLAHISDIIFKDGFLEVYDLDYDDEEHGGFGVVTATAKYGFKTYAVEKGCIPELTDDVIFASAVIDGKLIVLRENKEEEECEK